MHLGERECSIQRRHQKIIEETPSPALDHDLRERMGAAAVKAGEAIGYQSAGTVEFILGADRQFYFLEVNTRLQVEHPVTEAVTGLDLVAEQIRIAQGERLRFIQDELPFDGHALEVRIYAEDPGNGFLPQTGTVIDWHVEPMAGLRVDSGVETGSEIGIHYDPMLAKVITHGADRAEAIQKMIRALRGLSVQGVTTNRDFLLRVLDHPAFRAGELSTHFIDDHLSDALSSEPGEEALRRAALAATLAGVARRRAKGDAVQRQAQGYRNNAHTPQWVSFDDGSEGGLRVEYRHLGGDRFEVSLGADTEQTLDARLLAFDGADLRWAEGPVLRKARVIVDGPPEAERYHVHSLEGSLSLRELPRFPDRSAVVVPGACVAPMPGKIVQLRVASGDAVRQGQVLLVMEAMKMEHTVTAPEDGVVSALHVAEGDQVEADALLAVVTSD